MSAFWWAFIGRVLMLVMPVLLALYFKQELTDLYERITWSFMP